MKSRFDDKGCKECRSVKLSHQFSVKVDKWTNLFHQTKVASLCFTQESTSIVPHLNSCEKLQDELRVWPPSKDILIPELTLVCNYTLVCLAGEIKLGLNGAFMSAETINLPCRTLQRVLQYAYKSPDVPPCVLPLDSQMEVAMTRFTKALQDPVVHFRLMDFIGHVIHLCSICCLYTRQQGDIEKTKVMLTALDQLRQLTSQSALQEQFLQKQGLLLCSHHDEDTTDNFIYVGDVIQLVLLSCHMTSEKGCVLNPHWHWLDVVLQCQEMMRHGKFTCAMKKLETELSRQSVPELKSKLLCIFAQCYLKEGCPQLAIQAYKDALQTFEGHSFVLFHLANVYSILGMEELEMESLNLLVKTLSKRHAKAEPKPFTTEIDAVIASVCQVIPEISLATAIYHFAKRCTQLHRYKEAAEQYLALMNLLNDTTVHSLELKADVTEVMVETAEALLLAQQYSDCIPFCEEVYPYLITDNTCPQMLHKVGGQSTSSVFHKNSSLNSISSDSSRKSLFSQQNSVVRDVAGTDQHQAFSPGMSSNNEDTGTYNNEGTIMTTKYIKNLPRLSRKRMRSASAITESQDEDCEDAWWSRSLAVKLLLCKIDAMVASQGFTDDSMSCLTKAYMLLMDPKKAVFKQQDQVASSPSQPPLKRSRRLDKADVDPQNVGEADTGGSCKDESEKQAREEILGSHVSLTWSKSMVNVALRMAKAFLKKRQFGSVLNSSHLVLQLQPDNIYGHYLKTLIFHDQNCQKEETSRLWLQARGINVGVPVSVLQSIKEEKQTNIRRKKEEKDSSGKQWWQTSEVNLLSLDVACLNNITQSMQT